MSLIHYGLYHSCSIFIYHILGPFTRPHPAIWRIVFGEYLPKVSEGINSLNLDLRIFLSKHCVLLLPRSECPLLPLPGFNHLPQLAAGEAADVLAGSEPALCQKRGRYNGERCRLAAENNFPVDLHALICATIGRLLITVMRLRSLLPTGIRRELPCHHLGENPESF